MEMLQCMCFSWDEFTAKCFCDVVMKRTEIQRVTNCDDNGFVFDRSTSQGGPFLCSWEVPCSACCQAPHAICSHASQQDGHPFCCEWTI
jgi:hypothetical protein